MLSTTTILNDYFTKNSLLEECIEQKQKKCFQIGNEDEEEESILMNQNEIKSIFQNYNNLNDINLQFLVTPSVNNELALEIHENNRISNTIKSKIISILLDQNQNIDNELQIINEKLNHNNKYTILFLLKKFNHQFKTKKGLSKIKFEDLGIEGNNQGEDDECPRNS